MKFFIGTCLVICLVQFACATDYCEVKCVSDSPHVGCNASNQLAARCYGGQIYNLNATEIQYILHLHNELRNSMCSGSISGYAPCARNGKLKWNNELAKLAGYNTRTCYGSHDKCRNTDQFKYAGQNVQVTAAWSNSKTYPPAFTAIKQAVNNWFDEYKYTDSSDVRKLGALERNGKLIGHFAQVMLANATEIGCGATRYFQTTVNGNGQGRFYLACDYSAGLVLARPIYEESSEGGSGCTTGTDRTYPALCSANEPLDPNAQVWRIGL